VFLSLYVYLLALFDDAVKSSYYYTASRVEWLKKQKIGSDIKRKCSLPTYGSIPPLAGGDKENQDETPSQVSWSKTSFEPPETLKLLQLEPTYRILETTGMLMLTVHIWKYQIWAWHYWHVTIWKHMGLHSAGVTNKTMAQFQYIVLKPNLTKNYSTFIFGLKAFSTMNLPQALPRSLTQNTPAWHLSSSRLCNTSAIYWQRLQLIWWPNAELFHDGAKVTRCYKQFLNWVPKTQTVLNVHKLAVI
jgi:hypothetical protein